MSSSSDSSSSSSVFDKIKQIQSSPALISTALTKQLNIKHPVILAGMNQASNPALAAAVSNAGGLGVIGGVGYTPKMLREMIQELKSFLRDPQLPWGIDLLLPAIGGSARKTNKDYTKGSLMELIDIIVEEKATLFVSAVGVPPKEVIDKLHNAGIICANMVGHEKHALKAIEAGTDIIIAQGGEAGGHTGNIPSSVLIPIVVDVVRGHKSKMTGKQIEVVAAGGIFDGRGLASALCHGASAVWVGTRFVCAEESGAPRAHKEAILKASHESIVKTTIFTGRPLHIVNTDYIRSWEEDRPAKIKELQSQGIVPVEWDLEQECANEQEEDAKIAGVLAHHFAGRVAAVVNTVEPAKEILDRMTKDAAVALRNGNGLLVSTSKL